MTRCEEPNKSDCFVEYELCVLANQMKEEWEASALHHKLTTFLEHHVGAETTLINKTICFGLGCFESTRITGTFDGLTHSISQQSLFATFSPVDKAALHHKYTRKTRNTAMPPNHTSNNNSTSLSLTFLKASNYSTVTRSSLHSRQISPSVKSSSILLTTAADRLVCSAMRLRMMV